MWGIRDGVPLSSGRLHSSAVGRVDWRLDTGERSGKEHKRGILRSKREWIEVVKTGVKRFEILQQKLLRRRSELASNQLVSEIVAGVQVQLRRGVGDSEHPGGWAPEAPIPF